MRLSSLKTCILIFMLLIFPLQISGPSLAQTESEEITNEIPIFFNFTIDVPSNNVERIQVFNLIHDQLLRIGINADIHLADIEFMGSRTFLNFEDPVPLFKDGGYDAYGVGFITYEKNTHRHFGYLNRNFISSINTSLTGENPHHNNYNNQDFWAAMIQYFGEVNLTKRMQIFDSIQKYFLSDLPMIGLYSHPLLIMQSDEINMSATEVTAFLSQAHPSTLADLETDSPDDTITMYLNKNLELRNVFVELNPLYEFDVFFQLIYQPLYETKVGDPLTWQPLIAESLPVWNENHTTATINLREDVYFSDGSQLDAYDVNATYSWYINNKDAYNIQNDQNATFSKYLDPVEPIRILDNFTVEFVFSQPYVHAMNLFNYEIIPEHILSMSVFPREQSISQTILDDLLTNGTTDLLVGTGPFKFDSFEYTISNATFNFIKNTNYWNGPVQTSNIEIISFVPREDFPELVASGIIDLAILRTSSIPSRFNTSQFDSLDNFSYFRLPESFIQIMGFNLIHPVLGNGSQTPLGMTNPNRAEEAARYVRQAMNTIISREMIVDTLSLNNTYDRSHFQPIISHLHPTVHGYKPGNLTYDLDTAKQLMEMAGYKYPKDDNSDPTNQNDIDSQNRIYHSSWLLILSTLVVIRRLPRRGMNKKVKHP